MSFTGLRIGSEITGSGLGAQTMRCMQALLGYILPCIAVLLVIRFVLRPKRYVFRKLLHFVAFSCTAYSILTAESWKAASMCFLVVAAFLYPVLALLERAEWFTSLLVEKEPGEIKMSFLMLFLNVALVAAIGGGIFGNRPASAAAVLMWGCGDAAAALVGIPWGRHKLDIGFEKGRKSLEGTLADFAVSLAAGMIFLCVYEGMSAQAVLLPVLLAAASGAFVELISASEYDTVTVPAAVLAVLLVLLR